VALITINHNYNFCLKKIGQKRKPVIPIIYESFSIFISINFNTFLGSKKEGDENKFHDVED
jgi:hypothetical protein